MELHRLLRQVHKSGQQRDTVMIEFLTSTELRVEEMKRDCGHGPPLQCTSIPSVKETCVNAISGAMTPKLRILTAMRRGVPDRVPVYPGIGPWYAARITGLTMWDVTFGDPDVAT